MLKLQRCYVILIVVILITVTLSKASAIKCIDRITGSHNAKVLEWVAEWEAVLELPTQRQRRSAAFHQFPGFHFAADNVGLVSGLNYLLLGSQTENKFDHLTMSKSP